MSQQYIFYGDEFFRSLDVIAIWRFLSVCFLILFLLLFLVKTEWKLTREIWVKVL